MGGGMAQGEGQSEPDHQPGLRPDLPTRLAANPYISFLFFSSKSLSRVSRYITEYAAGTGYRLSACPLGPPNIYEWAPPAYPASRLKLH